jgi:uncharacterized protein YgfB (UPF0149 family)
MSTKQSIKLTPKLLKRIIEEEVASFGDMEDVEKKASDTEETDADEYADSLEKHIDYVKALKVEEGRLQKRLLKIRETKQRVLKKLSRVV